MTNLLISVLLVGSAITFVVEFIDLFLYEFITKASVNKIFALPLSFGGMFVLQGLHTSMIVTVPSATFVSLAINLWLDRPTIVNKPKTPRLY